MIFARRDRDGTGNDGRMATVMCSPREGDRDA
jgi:hypothetical protein